MNGEHAAVSESPADDDVIELRLEGRSPVFDTWFVTGWPAAYRLAALLLHDRAAAEDVAQDVLTDMAARWEEIERPDAYVQRAVTNRCWSWRRRLGRAERKLPLLAEPAVEDPRFDELADAVGELPHRQRSVIVLRYYLGLSESEIAETLGCRPGTVKSLASRALSSLARRIPR